jgi:hypothetical protein
MKLRIPAAAALVIGAFLIGRVGQAGDDGTKTVPATKYRVTYAESVCDYIHGGAIPVHGLFLPDAKVAAHLEYRSDLGGPDGSYRERPVLHAYPAEKAGEAIPEKEGEQPKIVNITIPQDLAKQFEDHAALTKRYQDEGFRLGSEVRARLGLEPIPNARQ